VTSDVIADEPREDPKPAPAAAADGDKPASSKDPDPAPGDPKSTEPPKPSRRSAERRIKRLSAKLGDAERRDADNAQTIAELKEEVESLKAATPRSAEPELKDYDNPREYAKAYTKWETAGKDPEPPRQRKPAARKADSPPADAPLPDEEISDFQTRGKAKLGDEFTEALKEDGTAVNQLMGEYMLDSDFGPEIYVHLANNPDESRKIFDSSAPRATKMMADLAAKAEKGQLDVGDGELKVADPPENKGKSKTTKAPKPPSDTKGGGAPVKKSPDDEDMDEYAARRRKEEAQQAGAVF